MPRVKRGYKARRRRNKILKAAKGFQGGRRTLFRTAKQTVLRAWAYQYRDRRVRKRQFRRLWIASTASNLGDGVLLAANPLGVTVGGLVVARLLPDGSPEALLARHDQAHRQRVPRRQHHRLGPEALPRPLPRRQGHGDHIPGRAGDAGDPG